MQTKRKLPSTSQGKMLEPLQPASRASFGHIPSGSTAQMSLGYGGVPSASQVFTGMSQSFQSSSDRKGV